MGNTVYLVHCEIIIQGHPVFGIFHERRHEDKSLVGLVYVPDEEIDGHWLVRLTDNDSPYVSDSLHDVVIGVTSHRERIRNKLYECARDYAQNYALKNDCGFKNETSPGQ